MPIQHEEVQRLAKEAAGTEDVDPADLPLRVGDVVTLQNEKTALVTAVSPGAEGTVTLDANHGFGLSDVKFQVALKKIER